MSSAPSATPCPRRSGAMPRCLRALGMEARLGQTWTGINDQLATAQQKSADLTAGLGAISKVTRMMLQSAVLTVGAYLVINGLATGGIIIASSILSARALAPIELAIGQWRSFISARTSWQAPVETSSRTSRCGRTPRPSRPDPPAVGGKPHRRTAGEPHADRARCELPGAGRRRHRHHRGRARPASRASFGRSSAPGRRCQAPSASTAPRSISGRRTASASISAICPRSCSSFPAPSRRTSPVSTRPRPPTRSSRRQPPPASHEMNRPPARRLRDDHGRERPRSLRRPAPADRARPRPVPQALPRHPRRAELEPRLPRARPPSPTRWPALRRLRGAS